jgi:hypothetical protein
MGAVSVGQKDTAGQGPFSDIEFDSPPGEGLGSFILTSRTPASSTERAKIMLQDDCGFALLLSCCVREEKDKEGFLFFSS